MDLVYMPEALSYGSLRHPQYRDYEQPWNKDYFNYGKSTTRGRNQQFQKTSSSSTSSPSSLSSSPPSSSSSSSSLSSSSKSVCLICKENKRRTLAAYIKGKARNNSCSEIHEEIEEEEEKEEEEKEEEGEFVSKEENKNENFEGSGESAAVEKGDLRKEGEKKTASSIPAPSISN